MSISRLKSRSNQDPLAPMPCPGCGPAATHGGYPQVSLRIGTHYDRGPAARPAQHPCHCVDLGKSLQKSRESELEDVGWLHRLCFGADRLDVSQVKVWCHPHEACKQRIEQRGIGRRRRDEASDKADLPVNG